MLTLDGVNLNATNTTIQTGLSYTWKVGDDGKTYALQYTGIPLLFFISFYSWQANMPLLIRFHLIRRVWELMA